jgi:excisionase family DNA binding protein
LSVAKQNRPAPPRLALRPDEAAQALGMSPDHFERFVAGDLRWARLGRLKIVPVTELERWLAQHAARDLA